MSDKKQTDVYSLSMEEVSLALGMSGNPDLGSSMLREVYPELAPERADALLTAASHSMLARNLCRMGAEGTIELDPDFKMAVEPLHHFDYLLTLTLVYADSQVGVILRVQRGRRFTSQLVKAGVVHVLESGESQGLGNFLLGVLQVFGHDNQGAAPAQNLKLNLGTVKEAIEAVGKGQPAASLFKQAGWNDGDADAVGEDFAFSSGRIVLVRLEAGDVTPAAQAEDAPRQTLLGVKGKARSWVFEFPGSRPETPGTAHQVTKMEFEQVIRRFAA
jgi:hypothetical protein